MKCEGRTCQNEAVIEILYDVGDGDSKTHQLCKHHSELNQFQQFIIETNDIPYNVEKSD